MAIARVLASGVLAVLPFAAFAQMLPMPQHQALAIAQSRCDDIGFAAGDKSVADECKSQNLRGEAELQQLRHDPSIRLEYWVACNAAVGFESSPDYGAWAQCVRFVKRSCPPVTTTSDDTYRRCLRAISSDGWIANRASQ